MAIQELSSSPTIDYWSRLLVQARDSSLVSGLPFLQTLRHRAQAIAAEFALPTKRDEEWQFTDLSDLLEVEFQPAQPDPVSPVIVAPFTLPEAQRSRLVFVNGIFAPDYSDCSALPPGVYVGNLVNLPEPYQAQLPTYLGQADGSDDVFSALNRAGFTDTAIAWIPAECVVENPIHFLFLTVVSEIPALIQPRILVVAGAHSQVTLVESYGAVTTHCTDVPQQCPYFNNGVSEIFLAEHAQLTHIRNQRESGDSFQVAKTAIAQAKASRYRLFDINLGAKLSRHNLDIWQQGEQTETDLLGLTAIAARQIADTHSVIYLRHPQGRTYQLHKTIVDDYAQAIFNGKVFVPKAAQMTNAIQLNRNLMLSSKARINTKPELQITADNVKCSHGATVSQLEADELFYLRSRGLDDNDARHLLIDAFAGEILNQVPLASLQYRLEQCISCRTF